jgi:hypothetical protein
MQMCRMSCMLAAAIQQFTACNKDAPIVFKFDAFHQLDVFFESNNRRQTGCFL